METALQDGVSCWIGGDGNQDGVLGACRIMIKDLLIEIDAAYLAIKYCS